MDSSWHYPCLRDKDTPSLQAWGGHLLHEGLMTCFQGEGQECGEGQRDLLASAVFSNSFILKYSTCQGAMFGGSVS